MTGIDLVLTIVAVFLLVIGIIGCIIPGVPGTPLAWASLLLAFFVKRTDISILCLVITGIVMVAVEVINNIVPSYFTKISGGTKWGSWGAIIGVFAGLFTGQILLIVFGSFLGALIGEFIHDHSDMKKAFKSALYAFLGFITGTGLRLIVSVIFAIILLHSYFPQNKNYEAPQDTPAVEETLPSSSDNTIPEENKTLEAVPQESEENSNGLSEITASV